MSSIKDVARNAGVSIATVSRVLNKERVKAETERKVMEVIEELGYRPNQVARSLKTNRTQTIGLVVPDFGAFFMEVAHAIEEVLNSYGYGLIVCNSNENPTREKERVQMLTEKLVDGLIVVPTDNKADYLKDIQDKGTPVVLLDRTIPDIRADHVLIDNVNGAYTAVEHLVTQGFTKIGLINGRLDVTTGEERYRGFQRVHEDYQLKVNESLIRMGDFSMESGYFLMQELLRLPVPPDAIFIANYYMTVGAMLAIKELGIKVPDDVAFVGFDSLELSKLSTPRLTAVVQPMKEMGETAAALIYKRVNGDMSGFPQLYRLKTEFIMGESSQKP